MIHSMKKNSKSLEISAAIEISISFENIDFCEKYYAQTNVGSETLVFFPHSGILDLRVAEQWSTRRSRAETLYYSKNKSIKWST